MQRIGFKFGEQIETVSIKTIPPIDFQHTLITGATGVGKTASMILPTLDDRIQKGHTILFFDHKGHEHKKVKF
ncbi:MAG: type IV secretory system conjugative DNA transfer family protein, partial [Epsilonproteobacteria bacterium]|nr:type IV secretory system conjugative DNA transfer family protein [Campylobacterota bacterium]